MALDVRRIQPDETETFVRSVRVPFLRTPGGDEADAQVARWAPRVDPSSAWVVVEGGRFVGNCATYRLDLALPGPDGGACPSVPLAGVSAVGVHPTHRRRGLLRRMMAAMLADAAERGEPVAGLWASQAPIYGRFGFGLATLGAGATLASADSAFAVPAPALDIHLADPDEAHKVLPPLRERARLRQPGQVSRPPALWDLLVEDRPEDRDGASGLFHAVTDRGYVSYRTARAEDGRGRRAVIVDLAAESPEVEAALWRFVLDIDLVREVAGTSRIDDPLRRRLADPRALRTQAVDDHLWIRILDVPAAMGARCYPLEGRLVLAVDPAPAGTGDPDRPDPAAGTWVLDAGPDGASCGAAQAGEEADLRLGAADLGTLLVGGAPASVLAAAGRIEGLRPGALGVADALFASSPAPFCTTDF